MAQAISFHEPKGSLIGRLALYGLVAVLLLALGYYVYRALTDVTGIKVAAPPPTLIDMLPPPPPPPPPPPEPEEKPPEPTEALTPEPTPEQPAPMQIDGPAQAGTDAFGLSSGKGGGMGAPSSPGACVGPNCGVAVSDGFYARYLSGILQERIQDNNKVNRQVFTADFAISIDGSGQLTKADLVRSSGDAKRDQVLLATLQGARGLDPPPTTMKFPQKITVRGRRSF